MCALMMTTVCSLYVPSRPFSKLLRNSGGAAKEARESTFSSHRSLHKEKGKNLEAFHLESQVLLLNCISVV